MSYWKTTEEEAAFERYRHEYTEEELARLLVHADRRAASIRDAAALVTQHVGCADNSCMFVKPKGMATNGGCRCIERGGGRPFVAASLALLYKTAVALGRKP